MLTTKGRYAVMAVLEMTTISLLKPVKLLLVANAQNIPLGYLEQIFCKLKKAGIVKSVRGPNGGYVLNVDLDKLKISNIIDAVDENIEMTRCSSLFKTGCMPNQAKCKTHDLWKGLGQTIRNYFEAISVADLIAGRYDLS
jgi:Rrf2 family iron-sulfur cluster assembly transcriptional regulator